MASEPFSLPGPFSSTEVLDCLADGILVTDVGDGSDGPKIVYANPAACDITGYSADELVGQSPKLLQGPDTDPAVTRRLREDLAQQPRRQCWQRLRPRCHEALESSGTSPGRGSALSPPVATSSG
jgi:PAS domain-containing protein